MLSYVVSDDSTIAAEIRQVLEDQKIDCPEGNVVSLEAGPEIMQNAALAIVCMLPDPERAKAAIREMNRIARLSPEPRSILAVGPADARLILDTSREGASEYLLDSDIESELTAAIAKLRTQSGSGEPGKIISVFAPSGGSGSSTIAVNLAYSLAKEHNSCALFDLKLGAGVLDAMLDLRPGHTLADLCRHSETLDQGMFDQLMCVHSSGVKLMAAPINFEDMGFITGEGVRLALNMARAGYPYVVIDVDRTFTEEQIEAMRVSDIVLIVLRLDFTSLRNTRQTLEHFEQLGIDRNKVRLVVNRYGQPKEMKMRQAEEALGMKVFTSIPEDAKTINRANNNGVPAIKDAGSARVSKALIQLAADLNGALEE